MYLILSQFRANLELNRVYVFYERIMANTENIYFLQPDFVTRSHKTAGRTQNQN